MIIKMHSLILTDSCSDSLSDMLLWSVFACSACPNLVRFLSVKMVLATLSCFVLFICLVSQTVRTIHSSRLCAVAVFWVTGSSGFMGEASLSKTNGWLQIPGIGNISTTFEKPGKTEKRGTDSVKEDLHQTGSDIQQAVECLKDWKI